MTSGNCVYCNTFQADLEGHSTNFHHMPVILPKLPTPTPQQQSQGPVTPATTPTKVKGFCPECGQKLKSRWYIEAFFLIMRYSFTAYWLGALSAVGWMLENGFHH